MANLEYRVWTQGSGWGGWVKSGSIAGDTDQDANSLAAIQIRFENGPQNAHANYKVRVENRGWTGLVADGKTAGREDSSVRFDLLNIDLSNAEGMFVFFRVFVPKIGWLGWAGSGDEAGRTQRWVQAVQIILHGG